MDPITRARNGDTSFFKRVPVDYFQHVRDHSNGSVLSISVEENHFLCTKAIIERCPSLLTKVGILFHSAAERGVPQIVKVLVDADVDANEKIRMFMIKNGEGYRPLEVAVVYHKFEAFKLMLEAFPDHESHFRSRHLKPLLLSILEQQHSYGGRSRSHELVKMRRFLLEKFPSQGYIKAGDKGWTALHYAASESQLDAIEDIIQFCPDSMDLVDNEGQNFLHIAADLDVYQVVEYILQTKEIAERLLSVKNNSGDTPLDIAIKSGDKRTLRCIGVGPTPNDEEEGGRDDTENDSLIPLNQRDLHRLLVKQFGNILHSTEPDKSTSLSLSGFLDLVTEMREIDGDDVSEEQISEWENKVTDYSSLGLKVSWLNKYLSLFRDQFQERYQLKREMVIKQEAMESLREEYYSLHNKFDELQSRLDDLNCNDNFTFLDE